MAKLPWILGNAKLQKTSGGTFGRVIGWGIPADVNFEVNGVPHNTCPGALACRAVCYAKQGAYNWKATKAARQRALDATLTESFVDDAINDIKKMRGVGVVRIHDSGDYFSQAYLDKWLAIARAFPSIIFYSYTKSATLDFSAAPSNFRVTFSLGGKYDSQVNLERSHSRIFSTHEDMERAGYIDGGASDAPRYSGTRQDRPTVARYQKVDRVSKEVLFLAVSPPVTRKGGWTGAGPSALPLY